MYEKKQLNEKELESVNGGVEVSSAKQLENLTVGTAGNQIDWNGSTYHKTESKMGNHTIYKNENGGCIYVADN